MIRFLLVVLMAPLFVVGMLFEFLSVAFRSGRDAGLETMNKVLRKQNGGVK